MTSKTSRRAFLRATVPAALALSAIPAVAMVPDEPSSELLELITAHRTTVKAREDALAEVQRIEELPEYPDYPRVQVGAAGRLENPNWTWPLDEVYAHDLDGIRKSAPRLRFFRFPDPDAARAAFIAEKSAQLERTTAAWQLALAEIGAIGAEEAYAAACNAEEDARIAVIAYRPLTRDESAEKLRYLSASEPSVVETLVSRPDLVERLVERLSEPARIV